MTELAKQTLKSDQEWAKRIGEAAAETQARYVRSTIFYLGWYGLQVLSVAIGFIALPHGIGESNAANWIGLACLVVDLIIGGVVVGRYIRIQRNLMTEAARALNLRRYVHLNAVPANCLLRTKLFDSWAAERKIPWVSEQV